MKRFVFVLTVILTVAWVGLAAQPTSSNTLDELAFMQGKWVGEGTSEMGQGGGWFSFESAMNGKAWLRRNHAEYPSGVHEDLMIVYVDGGAVRAFYTDTENHTIAYRVTIAGDKKMVTFVSDAAAGQPRYRLTYVRIDDAHMTVGLEMAQPDRPDAFRKIVDGRVRRAT